MRHIITIMLAIMALSSAAEAQKLTVKKFDQTCRTMTELMEERTGVKVKLVLKSVEVTDSRMNFYFTESLGDYPLRKGDAEWFREELQQAIPKEYSKYTIGEIHSRNAKIEELEMAETGFDGNPVESMYTRKNPGSVNTFIERTDRQKYPKGLSGRNIVLWQSHGYYFDNEAERWQWQRPCMFQTMEDVFTQSLVLPFLIPMLENAGAYVMTPRERDMQLNEIIADNDPSSGKRGTAEFSTKGKWKEAGAGFADAKEIYTGYDNPFVMGTSMKANCIAHDKKGDAATAEWRPDIPERGSYAVYISYSSLPSSTKNAVYTVSHLGGESEFIVNQKMGGGTWVYLGTFEFDKGDKGYVSLTSRTPEGMFQKRTVVTADAVRFGGGMGNIARGNEDSEYEISGLPRYLEGARYWLQWAGADAGIYSPSGSTDDYKDDYMSRGDWVAWISGGSYMNPNQAGKGIPVDLSLGFHSDAGVTKNDDVIGTLSIYTYKSGSTTSLPGGESRMTSREYADIVQSQLVNDVREIYKNDWNRRQIWDRGYRESRTPSCPALLLEFLSHQNFADMKFGLDPYFRFTVSRSVYKGMLKYLSNRYCIPYVVQPLPVNSLGVRFEGKDKARITWKESIDKIEPTATAKGYILYTRIDDGVFDQGKVISKTDIDGYNISCVADIEPGHIYSFRISAYNEGGESFPSETVSIGRPENGSKETVLVVNNFDRVSGPAFIDTPQYAGFDNSIDSGVPYICDIAYTGEMFEHRRDEEWVSNDNPGFGASHKDFIGKAVAGNTFDYPSVHGKAIMEAGYPFMSCSRDSFSSDTTYMSSAWAVDLICGKQITTVTGDRKAYSVFPVELQEAISDYTSRGGNILVSGANIATDIWDQIYEYEVDYEYIKSSQAFASNVLGYKWIRNNASQTAEVSYSKNGRIEEQMSLDASFYNTPNEKCYSVETPDGITPAGEGSVFLRYTDTEISAGICHEGDGYKTVCIGFPIETCKDENSISNIISTTLDFFEK